MSVSIIDNIQPFIEEYTYPTHCKFDERYEQYHLKWIPSWKSLLSHLVGKDDIHGLEIGTFCGAASVWLLDQVLTGKNSTLHTINPTTNQFITNNFAPYPNATFIQSTSYDALIKLSIDKQSFFDVIYIDGCHFSKYVAEDAILSFRLLKVGGIMIFDDYGWGIHTQDPKLKTKAGVDAFLLSHQGHYKIIHAGWQVYIEKLDIPYSKSELEGDMEIVL